MQVETPASRAELRRIISPGQTKQPPSQLRLGKPVGNIAIVRMLKSLSRASFEGRLGGNFAIIEELPHVRTNGKWITKKLPSIIKQGRMDCFARRLAGGTIFTAHTWGDLAQAIGV